MRKKLYVFHDQLVDSDDGAAIHYICTMANQYNLDVVLVSGSNHEVDAQASLNSLKLEQMRQENIAKGLSFVMPEAITVDEAKALDFTGAYVLQISPLDFDSIGDGWVNAEALITQGGPDRGFNMRGSASAEFKERMEALERYYPVESHYCIDKLNGILLNTLSSQMKELSLVNAFIKMVGRAPAKYAGKRFNPLGLINRACTGTGANWESFCGLCDLMNVDLESITVSDDNRNSADSYVQEVESKLAERNVDVQYNDDDRELVVDRLSQMNAVFQQFFGVQQLRQDLVCTPTCIQDNGFNNGFDYFVQCIDNAVSQDPSQPLKLLTPQYDLRAAVSALEFIKTDSDERFAQVKSSSGYEMLELLQNQYNSARRLCSSGLLSQGLFSRQNLMVAGAAALVCAATFASYYYNK